MAPAPPPPLRPRVLLLAPAAVLLAALGPGRPLHCYDLPGSPSGPAAT
eukprot:SAG22_NODE_7329_length_751_cov_1.159509_1_plen_47_part_10